jgi:O-acetyl-ADP-ribose deacetylase (regulator of RNase III)
MEVNELQLILVAPSPTLCSAFQEHFDGLPGAEVASGYFEQLPEFDCIVSAANSFGLMDGGVDLAIIRFFGEALQDRVQKHILQEYLGEQPIGTSFIIETGHPKHPYLAHTPTMRVPMEIAHTDYPYVAMWAMLLTVRRHNQHEQRKIRIIACPGLGTGIGRMPHQEAARQMALAYKHFLNPPSRINWRFAEERQSSVIYGGDIGFALRQQCAG